MYYNPEDTPLYISEYPLLALDDTHLLHMLIYWEFTILAVYQDKSTELTYIVGWDNYIRIYSGYILMQKNSHCVFRYFKTSIVYWDLLVLIFFAYIYVLKLPMCIVIWDISELTVCV